MLEFVMLPNHVTVQLYERPRRHMNFSAALCLIGKQVYLGVHIKVTVNLLLYKTKSQYFDCRLLLKQIKHLWLLKKITKIVLEAKNKIVDDEMKMLFLYKEESKNH